MFRKAVLLLGACLLFAPPLMLQAEPVARLWPEGEMPFAPRKGKALPPETVSEKGIVSNVSSPGIEIYLPTNSARVTMGVVICPGGAYGCLDYEREGREIARFLQRIGVAGFVLKYRLRQYPRKASLADLQRGIALIRSRAKEWKVSESHVGVMGFSAGGHLATLACAKAEEKVYSPVDEVDAKSAKPSFAILVYPAYLMKDGKVAADVEPALTNMPPTFVIAGLADLYRDNAVGFCAEHVARNRWPRIESHFYPEGCHGFGLRARPHTDVWRWQRLLATWLRRRGRAIKAKVDSSDDLPDYEPIECEE